MYVKKPTVFLTTVPLLKRVFSWNVFEVNSPHDENWVDESRYDVTNAQYEHEDHWWGVDAHVEEGCYSQRVQNYPWNSFRVFEWTW